MDVHHRQTKSMISGRREVQHALRSLKDKITPEGLTPALTRGATYLYEAVRRSAPVGDPAKSSRYRGTNAERPGKLRDAHMIERRSDKLVIKLDGQSVASGYGAQVHQGTEGRGKDPWMDIALDRERDRTEDMLKKDLEQQISRHIP